ncbi:MAG: hypothetical protein ACI4EA_06700 [Candidatus Ornithomonoglobus sp.]
MSRTTVKIPLQNKDTGQVLNKINKIMLDNKYIYTRVSDEEVWFKGIPMKRKHLSVKITENSIILQGWIQSIFKGEIDLSGSADVRLKAKVNSILQLIMESI